mmetsp:Transcript_3843/g.11771  ORF Transcript_3843/g.11771 Transcript_3843/m.11771 type:complete len:287 (+) Transcript_3843:830-1690(+)
MERRHHRREAAAARRALLPQRNVPLHQIDGLPHGAKVQGPLRQRAPRRAVRLAKVRGAVQEFRVVRLAPRRQPVQQRPPVVERLDGAELGEGVEAEAVRAAAAGTGVEVVAHGEDDFQQPGKALRPGEALARGGDQAQAVVQRLARRVEPETEEVALQPVLVVRYGHDGRKELLHAAQGRGADVVRHGASIVGRRRALEQQLGARGVELGLVEGDDGGYDFALCHLELDESDADVLRDLAFDDGHLLWLGGPVLLCVLRGVFGGLGGDHLGEFAFQRLAVNLHLCV